MKYVLALDIGTTSIRGIVYNERGLIEFAHSGPVVILEPETGAAEIDPEQLWGVVCEVTAAATNWAQSRNTSIVSIGISIQRNTGTFWNAKTGKVLHNFVTWQDVRCQSVVKSVNGSLSMRALRHTSSFLYFVTGMKKFLAGAVIHYKVGMVAMVLLWLMKRLNCEKQAARGEVVWGTIDSWLIRRMNGPTFDGVHKTEITHAAASAIYDPFELGWSRIVCATIGVPLECLGKVIPTVSEKFGVFHQFGLPIGAICGDANAGMMGEKMVNVGDIKVTMGTGAFVDLNTGNYPFPSTTGCYPLVAWQLAEGADVTYLAEADDKACGAAIDWGARAGFYDTPQSSEEKARLVRDTQGVFFIPALWGISSPINDPTARCALLGIGPRSEQPHCVRAILHAIAFRSYQLIETLKNETRIKLRSLSIDGGVSQNELICEKIATLSEKPVCRPVDIEASSRGAFFFAGISAGLFTIDTLPHVEHQPEILPNQKEFDNAMSEYIAWKDAIKRTLKWQQLELEEDSDLPTELCFKPEHSNL